MNENHVYDMIIVGGGPGGYTSALYAARAGLDTIVIEKLSDVIGNGINIQFGGTAYSNYFILERIKSKAKIGGYAKLFDNSITGEDIL